MSQQEHECKNIARQKRLKNVQLSIGLINDEWLYEDKLFASQKVVDDGEAEYVGQLMRACKLYISFCPECGKELSKQDDELPSYVEAKDIGRTSEGYQHLCQQLEIYNKKHPSFGSSQDNNGIWIIARTKFSNHWYLERHAYITEKMVTESKDGTRPDEIDELQFEFGFGIVFCPFCGEYLHDYHLRI